MSSDFLQTMLPAVAVDVGWLARRLKERFAETADRLARNWPNFVAHPKADRLVTRSPLFAR